MVEVYKHSSHSPDALSGEFHASGVRTSVPKDSHAALVGQVLASAYQLDKVETDLQTSQPPVIMGLAGSYGAVVRQTDRLSLLSDATGQFPIFYTKLGSSLRYSTSASELAAKAGMEPDRQALGALILRMTDLVPSATAYKTIRRVPAGGMLEVTYDGVSLSEWEPLAPDHSVSYDDAVEQLRESLVEAVRLRQEQSSCLSSDFSGGFDSTSLSFIAAKGLRRNELFDVFHQQHGKAPAGDTEYAIRFAKLDPRIRLHHLVIKDDVLPFDNLDPSTVIKGDLPLHLGSSSFLAFEQMRSIARNNVTDHMVGEGGDALFTMSSAYIADFMRRAPLRNAPRIVSAILQEAEQDRVAPLDYFKAQHTLSRMSLRESYRILAQRFEDSTSANPGWQIINRQALALLAPRLRRELADTVYEHAEQAEAGSLGVADYLAREEVRSSGINLISRREVGKKFGLEMHAPFLDTSVVRAVQQLAASWRVRHGQFKPMLQDALKDWVPDPVFARTTKGNYTEEAYLGFAKNADRLIKLLGKNSLLAQMEVIDPAKMAEAIQDGRLGRQAPTLSISYAAGAELWLRQVHGYDQKTVSTAAPLPLSPAPTRVPTESLAPRRLQVPEHVFFVETALGVVAYNLLSGKQRVLSAKSAAVLKVFQAQGQSQDAFMALQQLYPGTDPALIKNDLELIITGFEEHGTLQEGEPRSFTIATSGRFSSEEGAEVPLVRPPIDKTGVCLSDYRRMGRAMIAALKLTKSPTAPPLYDLLRLLQDVKADLPYSARDRVHNLLTAGHVLNRYVGKAHCVELTTATILAEARRGRRVDIAIGAGSFPRAYHAWPVIDGRPIQTAYDEVSERFTPFGIW